MIIDVLYIICLIVFFMRGYRKGFVVALFSVIAVIIALFCALKFSGLMAGTLFSTVGKSAVWIQFLCYIIVFIVAVWIVKLGASIIQKMMEAVFLGWLNRLAGAVLYGLLITLVFSAVLWFLDKMDFVNLDTKTQSHVYSFLISFAPKSFSIIGALIPFVKHSFTDLSTFFNHINHHSDVGSHR